VGERPDACGARFEVGPVYSADGHEQSCERSHRDSDQPDPASPTRPCPRLPLKGSGYCGSSGLMPAGDVQRGPNRIRITTGSGESAIELGAYPGGRPVDNSGDLCVGNALEVTEHQQGALESRQLIVGSNDGTELSGNALHSASDGQIGRVPWSQEGSYGELPQVRR
jgi:hypothetical protein